MKLISKPKELQREFKRLFRKYSHFDAAVAWAGSNFIGFDQLVDNKNKIGRMIIGLEFYQTNPAFIRKFLKFNRIRYILNTDGVFHPKFYLFYDSLKNWELIVGSPNFTRSAFLKNDEMSMLISSDDDDARGELFTKSKILINSYWKKSHLMSLAELEDYETKWGAKKWDRKALKQEFIPSGIKTRNLRGDLFDYSWPTYFEEIKSERHHSIKGRIDVLSAARNYFQEFPNLIEMPPDVYNKIAGFAGVSSGLDWGYFGSMRSAISFKRASKHNRSKILEALDEIPLAQQVNESNFFQFVKVFKKALINENERPIASATRLLAMRRPDVFLCLDWANREKLCKAFQLPKHNWDFERYWKIVLQIQDSPWWKSPLPKNEEQRAVWEGRVAFLDAIFYDPR